MKRIYNWLIRHTERNAIETIWALSELPIIRHKQNHCAQTEMVVPNNNLKHNEYINKHKTENKSCTEQIRHREQLADDKRMTGVCDSSIGSKCMASETVHRNKQQHQSIARLCTIPSFSFPNLTSQHMPLFSHNIVWHCIYAYKCQNTERITLHSDTENTPDFTLSTEQDQQID